MLAAAIRTLCATAFLTLSLGSAAAAQQEAPDKLPPEARQFDFWVGTWDVNLRMIQDDASWQDSVQATAKIYSILNGKAILELWDSANIKGYSLRYFDLARKEWVLWLNWPGQDRSGSSSLAGSFRHGRGDFYSKSQKPDGSESISRYSFNDITPTSLRWDDAYSDDGGKTWRNNWIMEFTRKAKAPKLPAEGGKLHTYVDGKRATLPQFERFKFLVGNFEGTLEVRGQSVPASWVGYEVLDGCAVLGFLRFEFDGQPVEVFHHLTWNTYASRFEATVLDSTPGLPALVAYSAPNADSFVVQTSPKDNKQSYRFTFAPGEAQSLALQTETKTEDGAWLVAAKASLAPGTAD